MSSNPSKEYQTYAEKLQEMQADLRWLVNECLKETIDEAASVTCNAVLAVGAVIEKLQEDGFDESEWNK